MHSTNPGSTTFTANGDQVGSRCDATSITVGGWVACYGQWIAPSNTGTVVINILNMETIANGNDYGIDDISFTYIPVSKLYYIVLYCIVLYCTPHRTIVYK